MKDNSLIIQKNKADINFKFYLFLKELNANLTIKHIEKILECYYLYKFKSDNGVIPVLKHTVNEILKNRKMVVKDNVLYLFEYIKNTDDIKLFIFALKLLIIKPIVLEELKSASKVSNIIKNRNVHPLSLEYDKIGKLEAYHYRVNGALIALVFFNYLESKKDFLLASNKEYMDDLSKEYKDLCKKGLEGNAIFSMMLAESINQQIVSTAGSSYEDRIFNVLLSIGIDEKCIVKMHDEHDKATEYDFFFKLHNRKYGISAKRTLRERYKQFLKTSNMSKIDVLIEITLGVDLSFEKASTITKQGIYLFVADEVFVNREDLRSLSQLYPVSKISYDFLKNLK